jgi:diadenosine tetraphosphate (Ap4A) HIT family hydrolase
MQSSPPMPACIFCAIATGRAPASLVHEDERFLVFLDIYPVRAGHALVIPKRHAQRLSDLPRGEAEEIFGLAVRVGQALRSSGLPCDDVNFLLNDGPAASQTVPHLHLHVVPRRRRDIGRVFAKLFTRPAAPLLPAPARGVLDRHAAAIRVALATAGRGGAS